MAKLFPFRGYRYNPSLVAQLDNIVTQPYDKISPAMLQEYLQRDPRNIARVISNSDYAEAKRYLDDWINTGVLRRDNTPSFYPYRQTFRIHGKSQSRTGFVGLISLEEASLHVRGHERVLRGPLQDRLKLIRQTEANEGLIFMLYSDPVLAVDRLLSQYTATHKPVIQVQDDYGVSHQLWQLSQTSLLAEITRLIQDHRLYIADGHHRFQTSVDYQTECLTQGFVPTEVESFNKRMIALFNMDSTGLEILPTHRGIKNVVQSHIDRLLDSLSPFFQIETVDSAEDLIALLPENGHLLGLVSGRNCQSHLIRLRKKANDDPCFMPRIQGVERCLDINILHEGILNPFFGIGAEELSSQDFIEYFRNPAELISAIREGKIQAGFLMNATRLDQVREISELGLKMPQKSTDFYPKLLTGLVLMKMEFEKGNK